MYYFQGSREHRPPPWGLINEVFVVVVVVFVFVFQ